MECGSTHRITERVTAGKSKGFVEGSDTYTTLYQGANVIHMAL